ncbi:MAG TPA: hypothetical protein VHP37_05550 [Burkholderiales bacterium]|nr:hypothetical protein [Burkholderiales bacterium]
MNPSIVRETKAASLMKRILAVTSFVTMAMTIPQVWLVWVEQQTAGVSLLSWGAYLVSALLWFGHGLQQRDKNIYLACVGWVLLDVAVIAGVVVHG